MVGARVLGPAWAVATLSRSPRPLAAATAAPRITMIIHDEDVRGGEQVDSSKLRTVACYCSCAVRMMIGHHRGVDLATRDMLSAPAGTFGVPS